MNKEQRDSYLYIAKISDLGLCNFCKFSEWEGSYCESDLTCTHELSMINGEDDGEHPFNVWQGDDCWAFRRKYDLQTCGVIASISMQGLIPHFGRGKWVGIIPKREIYVENTAAQ
jgi:hypothetical protein